MLFINKNKNKKDKDKWLMYWLIYSWLSAFENIFYIYYIPYYSFIKIIFLYVGFMPKNNMMDSLLGKYELTDSIYQLTKSIKKIK